MTQRQIHLVQRSWRIFQQMHPALVGDTFYTKLFTDHPHLRKMFPVSLQAQSQKLVNMMSTIVARLERPEELVAQAQAMGLRHIGYGVKTRHYAMVGEALLWTLQVGFGKDWNNELQEAWEQCYRDLVHHMLPGSKTGLGNQGVRISHES